jgi:hypothetical protein
LAECPVAVFVSMLFLNRYPASDSLQVLQGNPSAGAFRIFDDSFADTVIRVSLKSFLFSGDIPQMTFRTSRSGFLESGSMLVEFHSSGFDLIATVVDSVRGRCDVGDPEVNADDIHYRLHWWLLDLASHQQVERTVAED